MKVYILTEVWGTTDDEVTTSVYATKAAGLQALDACVQAWHFQEGKVMPVRPPHVTLFTHPDGLIRLDEVEVVVA